MPTTMPSIFNDVLGPVMRGPSSSHTAGSYRIGKLLRDLAGADLTAAEFEFHPLGSLATTYNTQGSDIGLASGLVGLDIMDPEMPGSLVIAKEKGISITFKVHEFEADHPNTYKCTITGKSGEKYTAVALSTGGGMIRVINLMGFPVDFLGDDSVFFAILKEGTDCADRKVVEDQISMVPGYSGATWMTDGTRNAVIYRFSQVPDLSGYVSLMESCFLFHRLLKSVMPIPGQGGTTLPF